MSAVHWIALWGIVAVASSVTAAIVAGMKRRDHSTWAAWAFLVPPLLVVLLLLPTYEGPHTRRPSSDEDDTTVF